jgi:hypothetical protein
MPMYWHAEIDKNNVSNKMQVWVIKSYREWLILLSFVFDKNSIL